MNIFGKIDGLVYGDYVRLEPSHNTALIEIALAQQAKKSLDTVNAPFRDIVIFRGRDMQGDYMGWRTGLREFMSKDIEVVAEHQI